MPISNSVLVKSAPVPDFIVVVLLPSLHFKSYLKSLVFNAVSIVIFDIAIFTATSYPCSFVASGIKVNFEALAYLSTSVEFIGTPVFKFIYSLSLNTTETFASNSPVVAVTVVPFDSV